MGCLFKEHIFLPDWMNVIHHEGFWLQVANTSGPTSFLQMEYGHDGTLWQWFQEPHPDPEYGHLARSWRIGCHYKCGAVGRGARDPRRLIQLFTKLRNRRYNAFHWNCLDFTRMLWRFYRPHDLICRSQSEMHAIMLTRTNAVTL